MVLDYEAIEEHLGNVLRHSDNLDVHSDSFFPVSLLDALFHYSEEACGHDRDATNRVVHNNFHGHDFDRWIDNMVAKVRLPLDGGGVVSLVEIDSFTIAEGRVIVTLPSEKEHLLLESPDGAPMVVNRLEDLSIALDIAVMFEHPAVDDDADPYEGFGALARIVRVVSEKTGMDLAQVNAHDFSEKLLKHFGQEMLPLIPSLWNDMEHIYHFGRPRLATICH